MRTSSAARPFVMWAPLAAVLIVLLPAHSAAQDPVKSFDQLNTRLKVGDTVWVTDARSREIIGKIRDLSATSLLLDVSGTPRDFPAHEVRLVQARRQDGLRNGTLIGFAVGAVGLEAANLAATSLDDDCSAGCHATFIVLGGAIGAGVGRIVDALIPGKQLVVYRAAGTAGASPGRLSLAPVITPRIKGVTVAFSF